jgi:hypothetical protein
MTKLEAQFRNQDEQNIVTAVSAAKIKWNGQIRSLKLKVARLEFEKEEAIENAKLNTEYAEQDLAMVGTDPTQVISFHKALTKAQKAETKVASAYDDLITEANEELAYVTALFADLMQPVTATDADTTATA